MTIQEKNLTGKQYPQTNIRFNLDDKEHIYLVARYLHDRGFPGYLDEHDKPAITKVLRYLLETEVERIKQQSGGTQPNNTHLKTARENIVKLLRNVSDTEIVRYLEESLVSLDQGVASIEEVKTKQKRNEHEMNIPVSPYLTQAKEMLRNLLAAEHDAQKRSELEEMLLLMDKEMENFAHNYQAMLEGRWKEQSEDNA